MAAISFVRVKSSLDPEELDRRIVERRPRFLEVPGLVQKFYGRDESTGKCVASISSKINQRSLLFAKPN
jgi:hypothetical protein